MFFSSIKKHERVKIPKYYQTIFYLREAAEQWLISILCSLEFWQIFCACRWARRPFLIIYWMSWQSIENESLKGVFAEGCRLDGHGGE